LSEPITPSLNSTSFFCILDQTSSHTDISYGFTKILILPPLSYTKKYYKEKYELILLTWGNNEYQLDKINCSKISKYFKELLITQKLKYELDIDYKNSIFIDDNPRDLRGLVNNNSYRVIRLCRGKYMNYDKELILNNVNSLKEIMEKGLI
jgi:FMN phosphatase YigB (HAD superfamily)